MTDNERKLAGAAQHQVDEIIKAIRASRGEVAFQIQGAVNALAGVEQSLADLDTLQGVLGQLAREPSAGETPQGTAADGEA